MTRIQCQLIELLVIIIGAWLMVWSILFVTNDLKKDRIKIKKECEEYCVKHCMRNSFECAIQCYEWRIK